MNIIISLVYCSYQLSGTVVVGRSSYYKFSFYISNIKTCVAPVKMWCVRDVASSPPSSYYNRISLCTDYRFLQIHKCKILKTNHAILILQTEKQQFLNWIDGLEISYTNNLKWWWCWDYKWHFEYKTIFRCHLYNKRTKVA